MNNTPDSPAKTPNDRMDQGGNYWTLFTPGIWKVLHAVLHTEPGKHPGSLDPALDAVLIHSYDLVIGNPPWSRGTGIDDWASVSRHVSDIARGRLQPVPAASSAGTDESLRRMDFASVPPLLPNKVLDLAFLWRAMEWAKPGGQIAFALHARLLFQQGEGMPLARGAVFAALDVAAVVNGAELRQTNVWPHVSAPFCLLYARNQPPGPGAAFRLLTPRLEQRLNGAGAMRIDPEKAVLVTPETVSKRPDALKILFRGGNQDLRLVERLRDGGLATVRTLWTRHFGWRRGHTGNGYQKLRDSSRIRKGGDGKPGVPADYLRGLPEITVRSLDRVLIDPGRLPEFARERIHDPRARTLFDGPMLIVQKAPRAARQRIPIAVCPGDAVFNQSFYGYSAKSHPGGLPLLRFLGLVIGSRPALWLSLVSSGEFGFERDTLEKATVDQIAVPDFDAIPEADKKRADQLFERLVEANDEAGWSEVDAWVARLYGLREADLEAIEETLRFNLPFAANRKAAQGPPSVSDVSAFREVLETELRPWGMRKGQEVDVALTSPAVAAPWRGVQVRVRPSGIATSAAADYAASPLIQVADRLAASQLLICDEGSGCLWVERLDQARYWSVSQARSLAREIIWHHVDLLTARRRR